jgi:hypothetical protein
MQRSIDRRCIPPKPAVRRGRDFTRAAAGLVLAALGSTAAAAEIPEGLRRCATESDDLRRLACYDAEIAGSGRVISNASGNVAGASAATPDPSAAKAASDAAPKPDSSAAATKAPADPADEFGLRRDPKKEPGTKAAEVSSSVAAFSRGVDRRLVVTLENGQVWREIAPNEAVRLQTGDTVRIERGSLGSFLLVAPNKRSTKVTRIK